MAEEKRYSGQALDIAKTAIVVVVGYKLINMISNVGQDNPQDQGGSHQMQVCDDLEKLDLTYPLEFYEVVADQIQNAIWDGVFAATEDDSAIAGGLLTCMSDADVLALICTYGDRGAKNAYSEIYNLPQSIQAFLDESEKDMVNDVYKERGISFAWI